MSLPEKLRVTMNHHREQLQCTDPIDQPPYFFS